MPRVVAFASAVIFVAGSWIATAARQAEPAAPPLDVSAARIRADIAFLADDLLEGREAATRGYDVAARYAAAALEAAGCAPGADDGSYFQQVPLVESRPAAASMRLTAANGTMTDLPLPDQGLVVAGRAPPTSVRRSYSRASESQPRRSTTTTTRDSTSTARSSRSSSTRRPGCRASRVRTTRPSNRS